MSDNPATLDLEHEATTAPAERELPYLQVGQSADVIGGAQVFLSRNRKAVARVGTDAPVFVTSQDGTMQQSIPYRAISAALTADVIPMAQVVTRYVKAGRLAELAELVTAAQPEKPEKSDKGTGAK